MIALFWDENGINRDRNNMLKIKDLHASVLGTPILKALT